MKPRTKSEEYFASLQDHIKLADEMHIKIADWRKYCGSSGLTGLWSKKIKNYYGISEGGNTSQAVTPGGSEGELSMIKVNDLHALIQEQLVIVTSNRPAGIAKAINSDTKSLKAARLGTGVAEYYMVQKDFEGRFVQGAEIALLCDESFYELFWNRQKGKKVAVDLETGETINAGDEELRVHAAWNVARDFGANIVDQHWHIISFKANRFDNMAMFPKFADKIKTVQNDEDLPQMPMDRIPEESDMIWNHLLVHDRTPAVPDGRYSLMIGDWIVLDTDLPYDDYPIERLAAADVIEGCVGYSPANDIMGLEQVTDALHSIIVSNEITLGGNTLVGPEGSNIKVSDLAKGLRYFELPPDLTDKLHTLEMCKTPKEVFEYIGLLGQKKERAVGSVATSLAQQASQAASGSSMALIQAQSISFNSGIQRGYFKAMSSVMTKAIGQIRKLADEPRIAQIVGKSKSAAIKEFKYKGQDLEAVSSVVYELVNPASQTYGGRLTMAQDLLKAGQIKSPKQYINVVKTGELEVLTQDDEQDGMTILEENERLTEGRFVKAMITENHQDHVRSHLSLCTPEAKENDPNLIMRVLDHVQQHANLWTQASMTNPAILQLTGQNPYLPPMAGAPMPPPGGAPPPKVPQGPGDEMENPESMVEQKATEVDQPNLPNIAGSDQKPVIPGVTNAEL